MRKGMRKPALLAALAVAVSVLCTGCSEKPDEKAYVRAALDAIYHRECGAYAELLHISENQAEEEIEKTFQENMETAFSGDTVTQPMRIKKLILMLSERYISWPDMK